MKRCVSASSAWQDGCAVNTNCSSPEVLRRLHGRFNRLFVEEDTVSPSMIVESAPPAPNAITGSPPPAPGPGRCRNPPRQGTPARDAAHVLAHRASWIAPSERSSCPASGATSSQRAHRRSPAAAAQPRNAWTAKSTRLYGMRPRPQGRSPPGSRGESEVMIDVDGRDARPSASRP